jgi:hypothetical protein
LMSTISTHPQSRSIRLWTCPGMPTQSTMIESKASYYVIRQQNISH